MIQICAARLRHDARAVMLECSLISLNCHRDWATLHCTLQSVRPRTISVPCHPAGGNGSGEAALAGAVAGSVWVRALGGNGRGLVERESIVHETTVAARVL